MFHYPAGTVRALLKTDQVTKATQQALTERLNAQPRQPTFFSEAEFLLLRAVCDQLIPQPNSPERICIEHSIDERLSENTTNGWRYDTMPNDGEAYRSGLKGIDESAVHLFQKPFQDLLDEQKNQVLQAIQTMEAPGKTWQTLPADRFFEELLAEAAEAYYSHPLAQEEIGYVGMADVLTWHRIGLNQLEEREPRAI
ncbi:gluconate 2-dehydrogenase subunit 3 family protein [Spirosoma sp. SC4-14]|uniref:gluconate 2-dehydrogenase subunit 3 family protein n=1 Tax=Spirosoma sp. SC4-14 TaxID=3128900 RepID=UPI0030CB00F4